MNTAIIIFTLFSREEKKITGMIIEAAVGRWWRKARTSPHDVIVVAGADGGLPTAASGGAQCCENTGAQSCGE